MKRRTVHIGFALLSAAIASVVAVQLSEILNEKSTQKAVAAIELTGEKPVKPAARLAWANLLSAEGEFERAESTYNELIREQRNNPFGQAALFNLANGYLRQGMRPDLDPAKARPMIELAKQRYRDLLRNAPNDWTARYNLERALRLAPETGLADEIDDKGKPIKRVNVIVPDFKTRDLP